MLEGERGMAGSSANLAWIRDLWALGCKLPPRGLLGLQSVVATLGEMQENQCSQWP